MGRDEGPLENPVDRQTPVEVEGIADTAPIFPDPGDALDHLLRRRCRISEHDPVAGGGIVSEPVTFDLILNAFYTIWLKAKPEEHMARVRGQGDLRPMADDRSAMAELRNILVSREPLYARANAVVDTAGLTVEAAAARLSEVVQPVIANEARMFARG